MKRCALLLGFFLLIFSLCCLGSCGLINKGEQSSPERVVTAYLEAFYEGNFDHMVMLSGGWDGSSEELEFTKNFVQMIELRNYTVDNVETISGTEALVEVTLLLSLMGQEQEQTNQVKVVKKDGKWYLSGGILD